AGSVVTSLLTRYVVALVWAKAFWRPRAEAPEGHLAAARPPTLVEASTDVLYDERVDPGRMPALMLVSTAGVIAVCLAWAVPAGPILDIGDRAGEELRASAFYTGAVVGSPQEYR